MKNKITLIAFLMTSVTIWTTYAQELHKCDSTKSFWIFSKGGTSFVAKLFGNAAETERKNVLLADSYALQYIIVDKINYLDSIEGNTDLSVLRRYAMKEAEYFTGIFERKLNITMQKLSLSPNQIGLIWSFDFPPEKLDTKPKKSPTERATVTRSLLFINLIIGDKIIGLSTSQFSDQKFEDVRSFLVTVSNSVKQFDNKTDVEKLCGQGHH